MKEKDLPEDEDFDIEDDNDGEIYANFRVSALDLAIKACAVTDAKFGPETILDIAKDYFKFIIGDDEEDDKNG